MESRRWSISQLFGQTYVYFGLTEVFFEVTYACLKLFVYQARVLDMLHVIWFLTCLLWFDEQCFGAVPYACLINVIQIYIKHGESLFHQFVFTISFEVTA
jgi:hypothetical protein